jgi:hypothetical protein
VQALVNVIFPTSKKNFKSDKNLNFDKKIWRSTSSVVDRQRESEHYVTVVKRNQENLKKKNFFKT